MSHQFPLHQADCDSYLKHFSFVKMRFRNMHTVHFALIQASWEKTWFRAEFQIIALSITFAVVTPFHTNFKRYFILIIIASHYLIIFDLHINIFIIIQAPPFFLLCANCQSSSLRDYLFTLEISGILSPYLVLWDSPPPFRSNDINVGGEVAQPTKT